VGIEMDFGRFRRGYPVGIEMDFWFTETVNDTVGNTIKIKERIFSGHSDFQKIEIVDAYHYGRTLILEGSVMLTEKDEFTYHEMISHVPLK
jgi:spermidine synthase